MDICVGQLRTIKDIETKVGTEEKCKIAKGTTLGHWGVEERATTIEAKYKKCKIIVNVGDVEIIG